jgi:hypothetical protein
MRLIALGELLKFTPALADAPLLILSFGFA